MQTERDSLDLAGPGLRRAPQMLLLLAALLFSVDVEMLCHPSADPSTRLGN